MKRCDYTKESINDIADAVREKMGLSVPVNLENLKAGIVNLGIKLTPDGNYTDKVCKHAPYEYEIYYNPDWKEQEQLFHLCSALGQIMLFGLREDSEKDIYTGDYICLDEVGKEISQNQIFRNNIDFSDDILRCEDIEDLVDMLRKYVKDETCDRWKMSCPYDFYNETMIKIQRSGIEESVFFVKFAKKEKIL